MATSLSGYESLSKTLEDKLRDSSTAYAPNTSPTYSDKSLAAQMASVNKQLETLKSTQTRNKWYGAATTDVPTEDTGSDGLFMGGLRALQRPLNAIIGTGQYALGKGTESSLVGNINQAMKTGLTAGNVLQQFGMSRAAQIPLGFALDVMFDPINWGTMGTAALIPRVGLGLVKGGFKTVAREGIEAGLETGLKSVAKEGVTEGTEGAVRGWDAFRSTLKSDVAGIKGFLGEKVADAGTVMKSGWSAKQALETGLTGLTSDLEKKAYKVMNIIPGAKNIPLYKNTLESLGEKAVAGAAKYDTLMGTSVVDKLGKGIMGMPAGVIGDTVENLVRKVPEMSLGKFVVPSGDVIADFFKYSPSMQTKIKDLYDKVIKLGEKEGVLMGYSANGPFFKNISDFLDPNARISVEKLAGKLGDSIVADADGMIAIRDATGALKPELMGKIHVTYDVENAQTLLKMAGEEYNMKHLMKTALKTPIGETGVTWYDDFIRKVKETNYNDIRNFVGKKFGMTPVEIEKVVQDEVEKTAKAWNTWNAVGTNIRGAASNIPGQIKSLPKQIKAVNPMEWKPFDKILTALEDLTQIFKPFKVAMNPGSFMVAVPGNFFMGLMEGLPVYSKDYGRLLVESRQLLKGNLSLKQIRDIFFGDTNLFLDMAQTNPGRFKELFGFHPDEIAEKMVVGEAAARGGIKNFDDAVRKIYGTIWDQIDKEIGSVEKGLSVSRKAQIAADTESMLTTAQRMELRNQIGAFSTPAQTNLAAEHALDIERIGTMTTTELMNSNFLARVRLNIGEMLTKEPNSIMYKALEKFFVGMPQAYEHIDQTFKIATTRLLTEVGVNEQQLRKLSQFVPISGTDLVAGDLAKPLVKNGERVYRLQPLKAGEVAMDTFMNYAAMPDFVKVMRALPIVGSNFYSFQYAMAIKTAKTLVNNPAVFNKVGFMINEMNAGRTPAEKAAMEDKYNKYLNSPTVAKLFGTMNVDVKNMAPYMTMNMFNPSQKSYDNSPRSQILKMLDNTPVFQTPLGQVIKDYWIQPWVLSGTGQTPQGQFGQPTMPFYDKNGKRITPSVGAQAFYQGRTFLESLVPGAVSFLGVPIGWTGISPEATEWLPSYGMRSTANATQGRSSIGAMTKEEPMRKTLLTIFRRAGVPLYSLDTSKVSLTNPNQ